MVVGVISNCSFFLVVKSTAAGVGNCCCGVVNGLFTTVTLLFEDKCQRFSYSFEEKQKTCMTWLVQPA